ncbi:spore germination protein Q [Salirhabdus euzebyi]|uniref:Spore germination protein Q n=1 Tax=Salirhabdus euzebyi TaxID=394506 RepID=A0A841Q688_9BACI|nr:spore coat protein GerQ [Salirhabdus euzebyi]MBB6453895.1 spore germination protein Q [Salirhabdus euzebyi]
MSNNNENVYGVPSFETGENPYFAYPQGPYQQAPYPQQQPVYPQGYNVGAPYGTPYGAPPTGMAPPAVSGGPIPGYGGMFPVAGAQPFQEESYIENILRLNRGKKATVYMTFENNTQWNAKVFKGILEAAGRDHIVISDPQTGKRYLLLMIYLDYVTFDEELQYEYPFA